MPLPQSIRQIHRFIAPMMIMPLMISLLTGTLFQFAAVSGREKQFLWLLDLHCGKFGSINLELIYPFLNALGLLTLVITGIIMWLRLPVQSPNTKSTS